MADFDPVAIIAALERHQVRQIVIGGIAARLAGAPIVTADVDVTPADDNENLERLTAALAELGATFRMGLVTANEPITPAVIAANDVVRASTPYGDLDIVLRPAGTRGFDDLIRAATREEIGRGVTVFVAALSDVIRSKEATGRPKDRGQLPILRETQERRVRGDPS